MNTRVTITYNQSIDHKSPRAWRVSVEPTSEPLRDISQQGEVWNSIETLVGIYATEAAARDAARKYRRE